MEDFKAYYCLTVLPLDLEIKLNIVTQESLCAECSAQRLLKYTDIKALCLYFHILKIGRILSRVFFYGAAEMRAGGEVKHFADLLNRVSVTQVNGCLLCAQRVFVFNRRTAHKIFKQGIKV